MAGDIRDGSSKSINVSVIAPPAYLREFAGQSPATIHHVAAQRILRDRAYLEFFLEEQRLGAAIVVDNGVFDLGAPLGAPDLVRAAQAVHAAEIILPDVMHDGPATMRASDRAAIEIRHLTGQFRLCAVVHAAGDTEWRRCYDHFAGSDYAGAIAFPASRRREPGNGLSKDRAVATRFLEDHGLVDPGRVYRLLGLGRTGHLELFEQREHEWIISVDCAAPVLLGAMGVRMHPDGPYEKIPTPRVETVTRIDPGLFALIRDNHQRRQACSQLPHPDPATVMMTAPAPDDALTDTRNYPHRAWPADPGQHTMTAERLFRYLQIKVHHLIQEHQWPRILVVGQYDRQCVISANEKNDKLFNWQRPTAEVHGNCLVIKCFPGMDYVRHYALIIATYLNMLGQYRGQVSYSLPSEPACRAAISRLDLDPSADDLVVVGWGLGHLASGVPWTRGHGYAWQCADAEGHRVLYLGYLHSIWGDAAGRVVSRLAQLGARRVVYVGKVGSLDPAIAPNTCLASGNSSVVSGGRVTWRDFFGGSTAGRPGIRSGVHVTSPSVLLEDRTWLAGQAGNRFVDPEIGHMGQAARTAGIEFGFLHVISNNLARTYPDDLSNERCSIVVQRRALLLDRISQIIRLRLRAARQVPAGHGVNP